MKTYFSGLLLAAAALSAVVGLSGCSGQTGAQGPAGPAGTGTVSQFVQGTVQGRLVDAVTQQPIVGAVVDIGVGQATTNVDGQFSLTNVSVPVDAANNANAVNYNVTIDLTKVSAPVNMVTPGTAAVYPKYALKTVPITFTAAVGSIAAGSANPLIATVDFRVGKLSAGIGGVVGDAATLQPVGAGYTVQLVAAAPSSSSSSAGGGTGAAGNVVASTTTNANGGFTFSNVEANQNFSIVAFNAAETMRGTVAVTSPADGQTKTLTIQQAGVAANSLNQTVLVSSTDNRAPTIISVTPENASDISSAAGSVDVVVKFSEPIKQDAYALAITAGAAVNGGLYNDVVISYLGAKAGNIAHTIAWNATFDQLTITLPGLAASSRYRVDLSVALTKLKDASNNITTAGVLTGGILNFTTNGSATPAAPVVAGATTTVSAATSVTGSVALDWLPVSGAKGYNIYRTQNVGVMTYPAQLLNTAAPVLMSGYTDATPVFVDTAVYGQNKLTYSYTVKAVGFDNQESALSNAVAAADATAPTVTIVVAANKLSATLTFSEPVNEASATNLANYAITVTPLNLAATVIKATLTAANVVRLDLGLGTANQSTLTVSGVSDIAGNPLAAPVASAAF